MLTQELLGLGAGYVVCIVDDSSPDGTSELVKKAIRENAWENRVHLITRSKKDGRGGAVRAGFQWGYDSKRGFEAYIEMDCDFSHQPTAIPLGIELLEKGADVVLGSRYPNGQIEGWPIQRRVFSFFANTLARTLIDSTVHDYTNGFRFYSVKAVEVLVRGVQKHKGYIYLSESLSQLLRAGMRIAEFPIYFKNRERGVSNTSIAEVKNALGGIFSIAREHRRSRTS
jgi:dolichol-phosphate mannosyltransferase